jgi:glucose-1-phosphate adenylyltransferase
MLMMDIGQISEISESFFEANIALADDIPEFNMFDNVNKIFTRARLLPPAKFTGVTFSKAIVAEGSIVQAKLIENHYWHQIEN